MPSQITDIALSDLRAEIRRAGDWAHAFNQKDFNPSALAQKETDSLSLNGFHVKEKEDGSHVTFADEEVQRRLVNYLSRSFPTIPIVSEEQSHADNVAALKRTLASKNGQTYWTIDPIDGTRNYIQCGRERTGDKTRRHWGILVGLVHEGKPVAGFAYYPELGKYFYTEGQHSYVETRQADGCWAKTRLEMKPPQGPIRITHAMAQEAPYSQLVKQNQAETVDNLPDSTNYPLWLGALEGKLDCCESVKRTASDDVYSPYIWDLLPLSAIAKKAGGDLYDAIDGITPVNFNGFAGENFDFAFRKSKSDPSLLLPGFEGKSLRFLSTIMQHPETATRIARFEKTMPPPASRWAEQVKQASAAVNQR